MTDDKKPREFWIYGPNVCKEPSALCQGLEMEEIHVIEHSAYSQLQKDYAVCDAERDTLKAKIEQMANDYAQCDEERIKLKEKYQDKVIESAETFIEASSLRASLKLAVEALEYIKLDAYTSAPSHIQTLSREAIEKIKLKHGEI